MTNEFWASIQEIKLIAKDTSQVTLGFQPGTFHFLAGQYVWLVLPNVNKSGETKERRAFSITSSVRDKNQITIQFKNSESGFKKTLLAYKPDTQVKIIGPFGSSYVPIASHKKIVMIADGVYIAPFLSILRSLDSTSTIQFSLLYINSSPEFCIAYEELLNITRINNIPFVSYIGTFNENIIPNDCNFSEDIFFICGDYEFTQNAYRVLASKQVPMNHMHFEQYYPVPEGNLKEGDFILKEGEQNIMLQAIQDSKNHVIITDANGIVIFANKSAEHNTGYSFEEMRGNTPRLWGGLMGAEFYQTLWRKKNEILGFDGEIMNRRKNGDIYFVIAHVSPIKNNKGTVIGYIGTEEDITKEKQINKAKTEFISLASHQLRTPLATIKWYCEMLLHGDAGEVTSEQRNFIQEAYNGSKRMTKLVNALLNVSRIESGVFMVQPELTDVAKIIHSVLDENKLFINEKKLIIDLQKEEIPQMMLDPNLMTIIIQNLFTNSIKYTPNGGTINIDLKILKAHTEWVGISIYADSILIQVTDTGMGIPAYQKNLIFEKLFRADNVRKSNSDGTGLGLYLIKSLIEHSKGKIWFQSEEGKGSTFYVLLPLSGMIKKEGSKRLE